MAKRHEARIEIRISPADKKSCELKAKACGLDLSAWIRRRLLLDKPTTPVPSNAQSAPPDSIGADTSPSSQSTNDQVAPQPQ